MLEQKARRKFSRLAVWCLRFAIFQTLTAFLLNFGGPHYGEHKDLIVTILAIAPIFIASIACGHIALQKIKEKAQIIRGKWLALASLFVAYFEMGFLIFLLLAGPKLAEKTERMGCVFRIQLIAGSAKVWCDDHSGFLPTNFVDMSNELANARIIVCPGDKSRELVDGLDHTHWYWIQPYIGSKFDPTNSSYEFLTPGKNLSNIQDEIVFRCPIHGWVVLGKDISSTSLGNWTNIPVHMSYQSPNK